jgi:hypothetical protein
VTVRSNGWTLGGIAVVAYALCDMIHEVVGHGVAVLLDPAVTAVTLSSVALSTEGSSRWVAAAGTLANLGAALVALGLLRVRRLPPTGRYFVWLLLTLDLFNATAYFLYSGILGSGDWAVVIAGLEPGWLWRLSMIAVGGATYALAVYVAAVLLGRLLRDGTLSGAETRRLCFLPYGVGGMLLVVAAVPNPVSGWLILTSGASSGFGAMAGLLGVPRLAPVRASAVGPSPTAPLAFSPAWIGAGIVAGAVLVLIIGRGIRL